MTLPYLTCQPLLQHSYVAAYSQYVVQTATTYVQNKFSKVQVLQQTCTNLPLTIPPLAAPSEHGCLHDRVQLWHQRPAAA